MTIRDEVLKILGDNENIADAVEFIYNGPKGIATYVIQLGLETLKSKKRRERRRELRTEIQPRFVKGRTTGSVVLSKESKTRLLRHTQELFGADGWMIGDLNLGAMTKEGLLAQAHNEEASAKGSLKNARFYRALAEPLKDGQRVDSYWKKEAGIKLRDQVFKDAEKKKPALV